ncbi:MAG TPA: branched-chain amino acid ABC transporter substrate-binding protein [Candidatus Dormibacteraeota bacterium]
MTQRYWLAVAAATLAAACGGSGPALPAADQIAIAGDFPLSGADAAYGSRLSDAARSAVAATPTIGRYRVVFVPNDDALAGFSDDGLKAEQNARRMAADPRVLGLVGPLSSVVALQVVPAASSAGLAEVSPSTTADCLTGYSPACPGLYSQPNPSTFFRLAAPDSSQGPAMADFAMGELHLTRFAVLTDGFHHDDNLARAFAARVQALGGQLVLQEFYSSNSHDFTELLSHAAAAQAEAIYVGGEFGGGACRIRAQMAGILPETTYFLGSDSIGTPGCITDAHALANGRMISTAGTAHPNLSDPRAIAYLKTHSRATALAPYTMAAYDAALVELEAIQRGVAANHGRKPSREEVVAAIASSQGVHGITGTWSFDSRGDATAPGMSFYRVENGEWTLWRWGSYSSTSGLTLA